MNHRDALEILGQNARVYDARRQTATSLRQLTMEEAYERLPLAYPDVEPHKLWEYFDSLFPDATSSEHAALCRALAPRLPAPSVFESENTTLPGGHGRIGLVRNRYNENAYDTFSHMVTHAKPSYYSDFSAACEDVADGRCEFCILPVESTRDGRLFGFYAMLDRYELRICAACRSDIDELAEPVRFALVGKHPPDRLPKNALWILECSLASEADEFPAELPLDARIFDASTVRIDSLSVPYDDGRGRHFFTFRLPQGTASAFHFYLSSQYPRYAPIGLYPLVNESNER